MDIGDSLTLHRDTGDSLTMNRNTGDSLMLDGDNEMGIGKAPCILWS